MKRLILLAALPALMACTAMSDDEVGGARAGRTCAAEGLGDLVGRPASTELGAEAMRRSGSRTLRWIRPGDMVTMDYSEHRLNVHLDGENRVERFACG